MREGSTPSAPIALKSPHPHTTPGGVAGLVLPSVPESFELFIGAVLLVVAAALFLTSRRSPESLLLAVFLGLVGENFLAGGLWDFHEGGPLGSPDSPLRAIASFVLAWDPFFLLAFATLHPYPRRTRGVRILLVAVAAMSSAAALAVLLRPGPTFGFEGTTSTSLFAPVTPERLLLIGNLAVAYSAAWILAIRAARDAPTPLLAQRAGWMVVAMGVAMVPRLGALPSDFDFNPLVLVIGHRQTDSTEGGLLTLLLFATTLAIMAAAYLAGRWESRRRGVVGAPLARALRLTLFVLGALVATNAALVVAYLFQAASFGISSLNGLRWLFFAAVLGYGVLTFEMVELRQATERVFPAIGAVAGATAAFLLTLLAFYTSTQPEAVSLTLAIAMALGAALPAGFATRALLRRVEARGELGSDPDRRLLLYRASVEAAWARGAPDADARRRLEQDRRSFGVSAEEARTLEHVVTSALQERKESLRPGDEPLPGVVIERLLGEGAQGRVFLAQRLPSKERVVVKELRPSGATDHATRQRFLTEMRALEGLDHPRIVRLLDARTPGGRFLLLLQHVDATPLSAVLGRGPVAEADVRRWAADLLDALDAAHRQGVVHRDVKPSNILIGQDGGAYLTDFGAATLDGDGAGLRATVTNPDALGFPVGSLAYMAPEQARGQPAGPASDLYALGLVLYEALVGRPALDLRGHSTYDALDRIANPRLDLEPVPPSWRPLLERALDPIAARRFPTAAAMRRELSAEHGVHPVGPRPPVRS